MKRSDHPQNSLNGNHGRGACLTQFRTMILRHRRERRSKCSLRGLDIPSVNFINYPCHDDNLHRCQGGLVLSFEGPLLGVHDQESCLILIDATWQLAQGIANHPLIYPLARRSLDPRWQTAYPRRQTGCQNANRGLASIEALYAAYYQLGFNLQGILDSYHWREKFLELNYSWTHSERDNIGKSYV